MTRRLLAVALAATVTAGLVGAVRQRREAEAVARGDLPRASAAAEVPLRVTYGPLAQRLSSWIPEVPRTPLGRVTSRCWTGPLTAVGFALAALGGARPRWDDQLHCYLATGVRGPSGVALRALGVHANTIGHVVVAIQESPSSALLAHEAVHVRQGERLGPALPVVYAWLAASYGYRDNPLERAARSGARRHSATQGAVSRDSSPPPGGS